MKKNVEPLQPNTYYHIYNRGINGEDIFKEYRNYQYFLEKYAYHIEPIAQTFAYCLLKNHFHLAIKTRTQQKIEEYYVSKYPNRQKAANVSDILSRQFSHLFNGYAQAINKAHNRTGGLFEEPFLRVSIPDDVYLCNLIVYIHRNPQNHGFIRDFKLYKHSSYQSFLSEAKTKLPREEIIGLFGDKEAFVKAHESELDNVDWSKLVLE
ncbi:MAG: hypothetical protein MUF45_08130 [Spirosomaceae bacterium]|jgi:hypothetical protein|nr:hypothetical protein [Spirosomataceae bacterium]